MYLLQVILQVSAVSKNFPTNIKRFSWTIPVVVMLWMMSEVGENSLPENSLLAEESQILDHLAKKTLVANTPGRELKNHI